MTHRALLTGAAGFVGQWLALALLKRGDDVVLSGPGSSIGPPLFASAARLATVPWRNADVTQPEDLERLIQDVRPDLVFHLAGISFVPEADKNPARAYEVNVIGVVNLLRVIAQVTPATKVLVVGSGTQYGDHPAARQPLAEEVPQRPMSVYAATKSAQETAALQMGRSLGLRVYCTRSFSHSGPGHADHFLLPAIVKRIRALKGSGGTIPIGNDVVRDYLHIDDVVRAYLALIDRGTPGEAYNVSSGHGVSVSQLARTAIDLSGVNATVWSDPKLHRISDMPMLVGSSTRLQAATGWRPSKTYVDILRDLLAEAELDDPQVRLK